VLQEVGLEWAGSDQVIDYAHISAPLQQAEPRVFGAEVEARHGEWVRGKCGWELPVRLYTSEQLAPLRQNEELHHYLYSCVNSDQGDEGDEGEEGEEGEEGDEGVLSRNVTGAPRSVDSVGGGGGLLAAAHSPRETVEAPTTAPKKKMVKYQQKEMVKYQHAAATASAVGKLNIPLPRAESLAGLPKGGAVLC
jgi:hypothetical protein